MNRPCYLHKKSTPKKDVQVVSVGQFIGRRIIKSLSYSPMMQVISNLSLTDQRRYSSFTMIVSFKKG